MGRNATAANKWNSVIVTADPLIVSRPYMRVAWYLRVVTGTMSYIQTDVDNESSCVRDVPPHNSSAATTAGDRSHGTRACEWQARTRAWRGDFWRPLAWTE